MSNFFGFDICVASIKKGLKVSRSAYTNGEYIHSDKDTVYINIEGNDFEFAADSDHILAEDWYIVI